MFTPDRTKEDSNFKSQIYQMTAEELDAIHEWMMKAIQKRRIVVAGEITIDATMVELNWRQHKLRMELCFETIEFIRRVRSEVDILNRPATAGEMATGAECVGADDGNYVIVEGYEDVWFEGLTEAGEVIITMDSSNQGYVIDRNKVFDISTLNGVFEVPLKAEDENKRCGMSVVRRGDELFFRRRLQDNSYVYFSFDGKTTLMSK